MKILHTADWHLGRKLDGRSRHEEQVHALDEICRIATDEVVDTVIIAGDIFDSYNPPAESEALFYNTMAKISKGGRCAVVVVAGNHDSPDRLIATDPYARAIGISTIGYPKDVPLTFDHGPDRAACIESAPSCIRLRLPACDRILTILALPYPSESRLREIISESINDETITGLDYNRRIRNFMANRAQLFLPGEVNIVASHLFVHGGEESESERRIQVGGAYAVDAVSFPAEAGYVALGHLHRPQELTGQHDVPIRYSGSILQYSFSEAEQQKEVTIVEFHAGKMSQRSVPLHAGHQLQKMTAVSLEHLEQQLAHVSSVDWLSISVTLDEPLSLEYMANLRKAHPGIINCIPTYNHVEDHQEPGQRVSQLSLEEQFKRFVRERHEEPCTEDVLKLFLELATSDEENYES